MSDEELAVYRMVRRDEMIRFKRFLVVFTTFMVLVLVGSLRADETRLVTTPHHFTLYQMGHENTIRVSVHIKDADKYTGYSLMWRYTYPGGGGTSYRELGKNSQRPYYHVLTHATPGTVYLTLTLYNEKGEAERLEKTVDVVGGEE